MVQIRFTRQGSNSMLGGFSSGDTARVDDALAAHLVNEARVAEYVHLGDAIKQAGTAAPLGDLQQHAQPARRTRKKAAA